jgi:hypothetical protein
MSQWILVTAIYLKCWLNFQENQGILKGSICVESDVLKGCLKYWIGKYLTRFWNSWLITYNENYMLLWDLQIHLNICVYCKVCQCCVVARVVSPSLVSQKVKFWLMHKWTHTQTTDLKYVFESPSKRNQAHETVFSLN